MKIIIYSRPEILGKNTRLEELIKVLRGKGVECFLNRGAAELIDCKSDAAADCAHTYCSSSELPTDAAMLISYGGDGTFLDGVRLAYNAGIPVLGINSGRLGFLANVAEEGIEAAVEEIIAKKYTVDRRSMLHVEGNFGCKVDFPYAFNEFSVQKMGVTMVAVDVAIDGEFTASYMGDGMILSTPSGSTAYSLSVGGPIVAPDCGCFVISPIASHNLTIRPLVVHEHSTVELKISSRTAESHATLDNQDYTVANGEVFKIKKAEKPVLLVKLDNISFYRTLREKMMWGLDTREFSK